MPPPGGSKPKIVSWSLESFGGFRAQSPRIFGLAPATQINKYLDK